MLGGSLVLLAITIAQGLVEPALPRWFQVTAQVVGYALLIIGFGLAMKTRREARENLKKKAAKKAEKPSVLAAEDDPQDEPKKDKHPGHRDEGDASVIGR